jgi:hypothetical protein
MRDSVNAVRPETAAAAAAAAASGGGGGGGSIAYICAAGGALRNDTQSTLCRARALRSRKSL